MKKKWFVTPLLAMVITGGVFAEEYTFYFDGTVNRSVTIQKDRNGKITSTPDNGSAGRDGNTARQTNTPDSGPAGRDGNTTVQTNTPDSGPAGRDGNTASQTNGGGYREKQAVTGNGLTVTNSSGQWELAEGNGNTKTGGEELISSDTRTFLIGDSGQYRYRVVIEGNTFIRTFRK